MTKTHKTHAPAANEHPLDEAVARALRDNLGPLQHTVEELQHAYADLISACASSRASNALPAMLRAQAAAASLAAGLGVLSNFVTIALQPRDHDSGGVHAAARMIAATVAAAPAPATSREEEIEEEWEAEEAAITEEIVADEAVAIEPPVEELHEAPAELAAPVEREAPAFDVASLSAEIQELHRRAKRVAKVAMQDIKMLRPKDVRLARENKDICVRLRDDLDKARKEYDRRFKAILDQPVDYFHDWMVAILADGDPEALGEYPYPSPVLRH
ncbi:MAG: hypothetical protein WCA98_13740 [Candidatus Acidiferrales bacterium]